MKRIVRDISFKVLLKVLKISKASEIFRPWYGGSGHILKFHRVIPANNQTHRLNDDLEVTPQELENCIKYFLARHYQIISLDELHDSFQREKIQSLNKFVLFTFDDGYVDTYQNAYPIFKKYGVPFSINLSPGLIEQRALVWWYLLEDIILSHPHVNLEHGHKKLNLKCGTRLEKSIAFGCLRHEILSAGQGEYEQLIETLFERYHPDMVGRSRSLLMGWDQVREMSRDPLVTIAAHTDHHFPLSRLPAEKVREEIERSRERIEAQIGLNVEHFAYPYGHREAGRREFAIVKGLGLKTGITTRFGNIFPQHYGYLEALPSLYKIGKIPKDKSLDVFTSGVVTALTYKLNKVITV